MVTSITSRETRTRTRGTRSGRETRSSRPRPSCIVKNHIPFKVHLNHGRFRRNNNSFESFGNNNNVGEGSEDGAGTASGARLKSKDYNFKFYVEEDEKSGEYF